MKRFLLLIILAIAIFASTGQVFADIGENFAPAGVEIYGDIYLSLEAGWIFWDFNEAQDLDIGIRPGLSIFIAQNLGLYVSPQFYYHKDLALDTSSWDIVISAGVAYYFLPNLRATTGLVPSLGMGVGLEYGQDKNIFFHLAPRLRLLYFVTDRIAPYVLLEPYFVIPKYSGFNFMIEDIYLTVRTYIGMAFYFPSRDFAIKGK